MSPARPLADGAPLAAALAAALESAPPDGRRGRALPRAPLLFLLLGIGGLGGCTSDGVTAPDAGRGAALERAVTGGHGTDGRGTGGPGTRTPTARRTVALRTTVTASRRRSGRDEPLELRVAARNTTGRALELLTWNTPFETPLSANLFEVTRDGEPVPYRGRLVKRVAPPPPDAFVRLAPAERIERLVDIARAHDVGRPGTYVIRFSPLPLPVDGGRTSAGDATDVDAARLVADDSDVVVERY